MDDLIKTLDEMGIAIMRSCGIGVDAEKQVDKEKMPTLTERVKAFNAIVSWVEKRRVLMAPPAQNQPETTNQGTPFDAVRSQFNSASTPRRRASVSKKVPRTPIVLPDDDGDDGDEAERALDS